MASTCAATPTVSNSQRLPTNAEGPPVQRSFRGVLRDSHEEEGGRIVAALFDDVDSTGFSDDELEERTGVAAAQLSRIRHGQAHAPGKLLAWAIEQSRYRPPRVVVAICAAAEGEFRPKPPPSVEERHAATLDVLHEMGIGEVVVERVARKLGAVKP
jgi:transcriptional regulator with XRE-family HTH domain